MSNSSTLERIQRLLSGNIRQYGMVLALFVVIVLFQILTEGILLMPRNVSNIIQAQLLYLDSTDQGKDIQIYLNTPGGSISAGLAIYDTMQYITADVATICTGMAASMGAVLLTAGAKGKRSALKHSRIMIHQPMGGAEGKASDIEITVREIMKLKKELYEILAFHTGNSYEKVENDSDRDYWMTSQEAKDYGMIDEILQKNQK